MLPGERVASPRLGRSARAEMDDLALTGRVQDPAPRGFGSSEKEAAPEPRASGARLQLRVSDRTR